MVVSDESESDVSVSRLLDDTTTTTTTTTVLRLRAQDMLLQLVDLLVRPFLWHSLTQIKVVLIQSAER